MAFADDALFSRSKEDAHLRMEMDEYRRLKRSLRVLKSYTDYEEELYEEAV